MSLFKTHELWSVNIGNEQMYDSKSLFVGSVNKQEVDYIWVGSHNGWLKIFKPSNRSYELTDLLYEQQLEQPILQMMLSHLTSTTDNCQLGILHPTSFSVWTIAKTLSNSTNNVEGLQLHFIYEHKLLIQTHSFTVGPFGGANGKEFLCIQGMNGTLNFYEEETATFTIPNNDVLLPMPLLYIADIDSFIILNSKLAVQCVGYSSMAAEKRLVPRWIHMLGVFPIDARTIKTGADSVRIIILTERNIIEIDARGQLLRQQLFDFHPQTFYIQPKNIGPPIITMCSDIPALHIYEDSTLKWCTKLDFPVISFKIICIENIFGILVLLSESGMLQCAYLGTQPEIYMVPPVSRSALDVRAAEEKLEQLQKELEETPYRKVTTDFIQLSVHTDSVTLSSGNNPTIEVKAKMLCETPISNAQIMFHTKRPLKTSIECNKILSICGEETVTTVCWVEGSGPIESLQVRVVLSYIPVNESPQIKTVTKELPLSLVYKRVPAVKDAIHKLTISSLHPVKDLNELFRDVPGEDGTAIGFQQVNNQDALVTLVAAKASQRYRIQSNELEYIPVVLQALCQRVDGLSYTSTLPLAGLQQKITEHLDLRIQLRTHADTLAKRSAQFRNIYKKVLSHLKDASQKIPSALWQILEESHDMMFDSITICERLEESLNVSQSRLANNCRILRILLSLMDVDKKDLTLMDNILRSDFNENSEQGWLEVQQATLGNILKTRLAKSVKDQHRTDENLDFVDDAQKFKKMLSTALDRITRGTSLLERKDFEEEEKVEVDIKKGQETDYQLIPRATKLTNLSAKISVKMPPPPVRISPHQTTAEPSFLMPTENQASIETKTQQEPTYEEIRTNQLLVQSDDITRKKLEKIIVEDQNDKEDVEDDAIWDIALDELRI